ncbi:hypothetical protein D3C78_874540 [compost metagenome]
MLLAILDHLYNYFFTRQHDRLYRISQIINIQYRHALQLTNLIQIKIIRNNLTVKSFGELDQLAVHLADFLIVAFINQNSHIQLFLDFVQNIKSAAPAIPLEKIRGIGNMLQLLQHKFRNNQCTFNKSSFANICNSAIYNDASI